MKSNELFTIFTTGKNKVTISFYTIKNIKRLIKKSIAIIWIPCWHVQNIKSDIKSDI